MGVPKQTTFDESIANNFMELGADAWNNLSWFDGFLFSLWVSGMYWVKCRTDYHFQKRLSNPRNADKNLR